MALPDARDTLVERCTEPSARHDLAAGGDMSFKMQAAALDISTGLTHTERWILFLLAYMHNDETGRCDPSIAYLGRRSGLSERQVQRCLRRLALTGLIEIFPREDQPRRYRSNQYRLLLVTGDSVAPPPRQGVTTPGVTMSPPPRQGVTLTVREQEKEKKQNNGNARDEIEQEWLAKTGHLHPRG